MNERGYVTLTLLGLLPVLLTILAAIASAFMLLNADSASKHICRVALLRAQDNLSGQLRNLIALNKRATSLRLEKMKAEAEAVASPGNPAAAAQLARIVAQQMALATWQRAIILKAKLLSRAAPEIALAGAEKEVGRIFAPFTKTRPILDGHSTAASFDVIATPPFDLTPDYNPSPQFRARQEMKVTWSFELTSLLPAWVKNFLNTTHLRATGECSATLEKGANQWLPRITTGRL